MFIKIGFVPKENTEDATLVLITLFLILFEKYSSLYTDKWIQVCIRHLCKVNMGFAGARWLDWNFQSKLRKKHSKVSFENKTLLKSV